MTTGLVWQLRALSMFQRHPMPVSPIIISVPMIKPIRATTPYIRLFSTCATKNMVDFTSGSEQDIDQQTPNLVPFNFLSRDSRLISKGIRLQRRQCHEHFITTMLINNVQHSAETVTGSPCLSRPPRSWPLPSAVFRTIYASGHQSRQAPPPAAGRQRRGWRWVTAVICRQAPPLRPRSRLSSGNSRRRLARRGAGGAA